MKRPDFMPWRDQLRLAWKAIRWVYWPSDFPVWANIVVWICTATILVCIATGKLWGIVAAIVLCMAVGAVLAIRKGAE